MCSSGWAQDFVNIVTRLLPNSFLLLCPLWELPSVLGAPFVLLEIWGSSHSHFLSWSYRWAFPGSSPAHSLPSGFSRACLALSYSDHDTAPWRGTVTSLDTDAVNASPIYGCCKCIHAAGHSLQARSRFSGISGPSYMPDVQAPLCPWPWEGQPIDLGTSHPNAGCRTNAVPDLFGSTSWFLPIEVIWNSDTIICLWFF